MWFAGLLLVMFAVSFLTMCGAEKPTLQVCALVLCVALCAAAVVVFLGVRA